MASGAQSVQILLWLFTLAAAVSFTLGWKTRISSIVCWVMFCSLNYRVNITTNLADANMRVMLFWCMFLPLDRTDARSEVRTMASVGFTIQLALIYWFTFLHKWDPIWYRDGDALFYSLQLRQYSTGLGQWLINYPAVCRFFTYSTMVLESMGPLLLFVNARSIWPRAIAIAAFFTFHLLTYLMFNLGTFPWIGFAVWLALIPTRFWTHDKSALGAWRWSWHQALLLAIIVITILANLQSLPKYPGPRLSLISRIENLFYLNQNWAMFAPKPLREDGWFVSEAETYSGRMVDPFQNADLTFAEPEDFLKWHKDIRWRKAILRALNSKALAKQISIHLCQEWNEQNEIHDRIGAINLYFLLTRTSGPGEVRPPPEKLKLAAVICPAL